MKIPKQKLGFINNYLAKSLPNRNFRNVIVQRFKDPTKTKGTSGKACNAESGIPGTDNYLSIRHFSGKMDETGTQCCGVGGQCVTCTHPDNVCEEKKSRFLDLHPVHDPWSSSTMFLEDSKQPSLYWCGHIKMPSYGK